MSGLRPPQRRVLDEIVHLVTPDYPLMDVDTRHTVHTDVTRYVAAQIQGMPGFLRLPYKLALVAFNWLSLLLHRRRFLGLPPEARVAYLARWSDGPLGPMRDFVKLIRSCALLAYFDHPRVMDRLEAERLRPHPAQRAAL
jgi:hypothetical protein